MIPLGSFSRLTYSTSLRNPLRKLQLSHLLSLLEHARNQVHVFRDISSIPPMSWNCTAMLIDSIRQDD